MRKQLHICGTWNSRFGTSDNDWNGVMSLLKTRELDLSSLITHRLSLDELLTGLNIMRDNTIYSNKVMIINDENNPKLSVSLMCADLLNLEYEIRKLEENGVDYLHIDLMDATFVPNLTFGPDIVNAIRRTTKIPLDIHLLMEHPRVIIRSMNIQKEIL